MTRSEFVNYNQSKKSNHLKDVVVTDESVTDPTFARTGRQLIFSPLNVEYRMKYPAGTPLDKDNPHFFHEYDKINPDTFKAVREARECVNNTKTKLNELSKQKVNPNN